ncbi:MAG TPA: molybdate ABC transporter substrate-binding protein [Chloroflexia bacterium]|nr:molybdate ABC transporter substrate-binding protein [Chloroflexia bacterium]
MRTLLLFVFRLSSFVALLISCLFVLVGCSGTGGTSTSQPQGEVVVFAASSLQDAFGEIAKSVGDKVTYSFGGSQALATQLSQGAKADVFASADLKNMQAAISAGVISSRTGQTLATNRLVVVTAPGSTKVSTLADLAKPGLKLVLADKSVPAGNYSLQALDKLAADPAYGKEFKDKALANVVSYENNVRQVLAKVQLGEADAGIVYTTDAKAAKGQVGTIDLPDPYNVLATYYIARMKDAPHPQAAERFVQFVLSDAGQKVLQNYGFGPPGANP